MKKEDECGREQGWLYGRVCKAEKRNGVVYYNLRIKSTKNKSWKGLGR